MKLAAFQLPWFLPPEETKIRTIRGRLVDRLFGIEYTEFEKQQIKEFSIAHKKPLVELTGFVSWIDRTRFLLLPTRTTNCIYFICSHIEGVDFPPNNQYIVCKGKWQKAVKFDNSFYNMLLVEDIQLAKPDFGVVKSDVSQKDFEGSMFEGWTNIDSITQNLLAQNYVSSPSTPTRTGGITLSLFNHPRQRRLVNLLHADMKRSIAPEILGTKSPIFEILELDKKHKLLPFTWKETVSDFDSITKTTEMVMQRIPNKVNYEHSVSLLSQKQAPTDFDSLGLVKSDYPIVIEDHVERKRHGIYTDIEATQFMIATHLNAPTIDTDVYDKGVEHVRNEIKKFAETKSYLSQNILGHNNMLNLDIDGKPLSAITLAISRGRSDGSQKIEFDKITSTTQDFVDNLDTAFRVWEDRLSYGKIHPLATLSYDEERLIVLLHKNGPQNITDICGELKFNNDEATKLIRSLLNKNAIYIYDSERYAAV